MSDRQRRNRQQRRWMVANAPGGSMADVIDDIDMEGHLTSRHRLAATMFMADLQSSHGTSEGVVADTQPRVDTSVRPRFWPVGSPGDIASLDQRLNRLRRHERQLMGHLVKSRELARGSLSDYGRMRSGYQSQKTARAYAVGRVVALLDTLADEYLGPEG